MEAGARGGADWQKRMVLCFRRGGEAWTLAPWEGPRAHHRVRWSGSGREARMPNRPAGAGPCLPEDGGGWGVWGEGGYAPAQGSAFAAGFPRFDYPPPFAIPRKLGGVSTRAGDRHKRRGKPRHLKSHGSKKAVLNLTQI